MGSLKDVLKQIPAEGLFLVKGLAIENFKVGLQLLDIDDIEFDTSTMTMLECSCVLDNDKKVFKYLTEEMHVTHSRDFNEQRANLRIHE